VCPDRPTLGVHRLRDEHHQHRGIAAPGLVSGVQKLVEQRPRRGIAVGVEDPPRLLVS
jgi:hypothetical protein